MSNKAKDFLTDNHLGAETRVTITHEDSTIFGGYKVVVQQNPSIHSEAPPLLTGKPAPPTSGAIEIHATCLRALINKLSEAQAAITQSMQEHSHKQAAFLTAIKADQEQSELWTTVAVGAGHEYLVMIDANHNVEASLYPFCDGYAHLAMSKGGLSKSVRVVFSVEAIGRETQKIHRSLIRADNAISHIKLICQSAINDSKSDH